MATITEKHMEELVRYYEQLPEYDDQYYDALVALRKIWDLLLRYNDLTDTGELKPDTNRSNAARANDTPCRNLGSNALDTLWQAINGACHYHPEDATQSSARMKRLFYEWVHDTILPFQEYLSHIKIPAELRSQALHIEEIQKRFLPEPPSSYNGNEPVPDKNSYLDRLVTRMNACKTPDGKVLCMRVITEMIIREKLVSQGSFQERRSNLSDMIAATRSLGGTKAPSSSDDADDAGHIQRDANNIVHWSKNAMSVDVAKKKVQQNEYYLASLISRYIGEYAQMPIAQKYAKSILTEREKAKKKNLYICIAIAVIVIIGIVGLLHLREYKRILQYDPVPRITEESAYTENQIVAAPELSVLANGQTLLADGTMYTLARECSFTLFADCQAEASLRYARSKGYMRSIGAETNERGMALLQYQFFTCDENGANEQAMQRFSIINGYEGSIVQSFAPGYYKMRVQAVGAADGLLQSDGKTLCCNTLWQSYAFVVLPDDGRWVVTNDSTGTTAEGGRSMPVKAGQHITVRYDTSMPGRIALAYAWDNDAYAELKNGYLFAPQLSEGYHTLRLCATQGKVQLAEDDFLYVVTDESAQSGINMTVQLGSVNCQNEQTLIVSGGETLTVAAQSAKGVKAIGWCYENVQSGEKTAVESVKGNACSITLPEATGQECTLYIEAVGTTATDHPMNSSRVIQLRLRYRSHRDELDARGLCVKGYVYRDGDAEPYGYWINEYDDRGNNTSYRFYTPQGEPSLCSAGYFRCEVTYDASNRWTSWHTYGMDGKLCLTWVDADIRYVAGITKAYDEKGNCVDTRYYEENGQLICCDSGYAVMLCDYSDEGQIIQRRYLDTILQPVIAGNHYATYRWERDENGRVIAEEALDEQGHLINSAHGWARGVYQYDGAGNESSAILYLADGQPLWKYGYCCVKQDHDEDGNVIQTIYCDEEGNRVLNTLYGYARCVDTYTNGKLYTRSYYDLNNRLVCSRDGYAKVVYEYTEEGDLTRCAYYDELENLTNGPKGWAYYRKLYQDGKLLEEAYYDKEGAFTPMSPDSYTARVVSVYDEQGRQIETFFYNAKEQPSVQAEGECGYRYIYDAFDPDAYYTYFLDANRKTMTRKNGVNRIRSTRGSDGNVIREDNEAAYGETLPAGTPRTRTWSYDSEKTGNNIKTFDKYWEPKPGEVSHVSYVYGTDPDGNRYVTSKSYFDGNEKPFAGLDGKGWKRTEERSYDEGEQQYCLNTEYLDVNGMLVICDGGEILGPMWGASRFAARRILFDQGFHDSECFDQWDFLAEYEPTGNGHYKEMYFGTDRRPMLSDEGFASLTIDWAQNNDQTITMTTRFYDVNNMPVACSEGYAISICTYADAEYPPFGFVERYYDSEGALTNRTPHANAINMLDDEAPPYAVLCVEKTGDTYDDYVYVYYNAQGEKVWECFPG